MIRLRLVFLNLTTSVLSLTYSSSSISMFFLQLIQCRCVCISLNSSIMLIYNSFLGTGIICPQCIHIIYCPLPRKNLSYSKHLSHVYFRFVCFIIITYYIKLLFMCVDFIRTKFFMSYLFSTFSQYKSCLSLCISSGNTSSTSTIFKVGILLTTFCKKYFEMLKYV